MTNKNKFKNNLQILRKERGLTQDALLEELNKIFNSMEEKPISKMTLSNWENNKHSIKPEKVQAIADFFNVDATFLLGFTDERKTVPMLFDTGEEFEEYRKKLIEEAKFKDTNEIALNYGLGGKIADIEYRHVPAKYKKIDAHYSVAFPKDITLKFRTDELKEDRQSMIELFNSLNDKNKQLLFLNSIDLLDNHDLEQLKKVADFIQQCNSQENSNWDKIWEEIKQSLEDK